ncbi:MAG TPA: SPOR domain-containing protein [Kofleriaceae bacterium]|nr:SPOR domain-containing protein [Kofleriaceae bacterium]
MSERGWCVMRQDDSGNRFVVASALTEPEARLLAASYEARGHKQLYWIEPMATDARPVPGAGSS